MSKANTITGYEQERAIMIGERNYLFEYVPARDGKQYFTTGGEMGGHTNGWTRLARCTASYKTDETRNLTWLMSYNTIVACYNKLTNTLYSYGRFSMTTYQHIRKFRDIMHPVKPWDIREVNLKVEDWF